MQKETLFTQYPELTSSQLHHITGGDWWSDLFGNFIVKNKNSHAINHPFKQV